MQSDEVYSEAQPTEQAEQEFYIYSVDEQHANNQVFASITLENKMCIKMKVDTGVTGSQVNVLPLVLY